DNFLSGGMSCLQHRFVSVLLQTFSCHEQVSQKLATFRAPIRKCKFRDAISVDECHMPAAGSRRPTLPRRSLLLKEGAVLIISISFRSAAKTVVISLF